MHGTHLVNHIHNDGLRGDQTLYVIATITNPVRFHSRYRIAREWIKHMAQTKNVKLTLVEGAFGDRHHELKEVCEEFGVHYVSIRTKSEIWVKENLINIGARAVIVKNPSCKYLGWIDADVFFEDPNWALEAVHQLQHFDVIQPWTDCTDMGPNGEVLQLFKSFGHQHQNRIPKQKWPAHPYPYAHTGFAWCATRRFWEATQGLCDFAILGSADHHMAFAMISEVKDTIHGKMCAAFHRRLMEWQQRATRITHNEVGFVKGLIKHSFHGPKKRRYYRERWAVLYENNYDPDTDLMYDESGVIQLCGKPKLEQDIKLYNRSRMEDSIEAF